MTSKARYIDDCASLGSCDDDGRPGDDGCSTQDSVSDAGEYDLDDDDELNTWQFPQRQQQQQPQPIRQLASVNTHPRLQPREPTCDSPPPELKMRERQPQQIKRVEQVTVPAALQQQFDRQLEQQLERQAGGSVGRGYAYQHAPPVPDTPFGTPESGASVFALRGGRGRGY